MTTKKTHLSGIKICKTESCRKKVNGSGNFCRSCRTEKERSSDLVRYTFHVLKRNAKRRNKPFSIDLTQFREFCIQTGYIARKGRYKASFHIDRIDETKGYEINNIQTVTNSENVRKFLNYKYNMDSKKMAFWMSKQVFQNEISECPF